MSTRRIKSFLSYLGAERCLADNTIESYRFDLEQFEMLLPQGLVNATRDQIRSAFSSLQDEGTKPRSLARKMSVLRHFYRHLRRKGVISMIPLNNIPLPKFPHTLPKPIRDNDFDAMLSVCNTTTPLGLRDYALLRLLDSCGLRASEVVELRLCDLKLEEQHVIVRGGKGDKDRFVPIDEAGIKALQDYLQRSRPIFYPKQTAEVLPVFPMTRQRIWQIVRGICKLAGLPVLKHPHQLRHRFGTEMVKAGLELREVGDLMGHVDIDTTQLYVGLDMEYLREVYRKTHPRAVKKNEPCD